MNTDDRKPAHAADGVYMSPRWSNEICDCSMPMTFDQHSRCSFGCLYCFSQYQKGVGAPKAAYLAGAVKTVHVERVKRLFRAGMGLENASTVPKADATFLPYIQQRLTMQWGGLADPFDEYERQFSTGLDLLRFFREIEYPLSFSTKSCWWTCDPRYAELFQGTKNWNVKISIVTDDPVKARQVERGVPTPQERLKAIERVAGFAAGGATLRLRPFMIGVSTPSHGRLIASAGQAGATAVSTEFFCYELRSPILRQNAALMNNVCGFDVQDFYRRASTAKSGYLRLNRQIKRRYVDEMEAAARAAGMRFYISDAHFKERCDNGSCCGLPESWRYSRCQFTEALLIAKATGEVTWDEMVAGDRAEHLSAVEFGRVQPPGMNTRSSTWRAQHRGKKMIDLLRYYWNKTDSLMSPQRYFGGILVADRVDANGNVIYRYNREAE